MLLGKTTTPEFGWKGVTDSPLTGVTRNPWDAERTPGGSSGGAAVAAAMGMGAVHIGTDGGGSIRIPASFTGIFGLKPTAGRVPIWPPSAFGTLSHLGPMTRSVADAARMLSVLAGRDPRDWQALPPDGADYLQGLEDGVAGLRIAVDAAPAGHTVVADVTRRIAEAARVFADAGAQVTEAGPDLAALGEIFLAHWVGGAAHLLAPLDAAQRAAMDPGIVATAELGQSLSLSTRSLTVAGTPSSGPAGASRRQRASDARAWPSARSPSTRRNAFSAPSWRSIRASAASVASTGEASPPR